jgi:hypothetical protein
MESYKSALQEKAKLICESPTSVALRTSPRSPSISNRLLFSASNCLSVLLSIRPGWGAVRTIDDLNGSKVDTGGGAKKAWDLEDWLWL